MSEITVKLPDIGEGIAESEISEWLVAPGDLVAEDDPLVVVITDKAAVEIPSSLSGKVTWLAAEAGEILAVGAPLLKIDVPDAGGSVTADRGDAPDEDASEASTDAHQDTEETGDTDPAPGTPADTGGRKTGKALAAPAVRQRAAALELDLAEVQGSGPEGRVTHADLDRHLLDGAAAASGRRLDGVTETRVIGLRRKIAEQMARAHASIPAITIIEEVDVTELERLRAEMNRSRREGRPKLTLLPFLIRAMDLSRAVSPQVNARYDEEAGVLRTFAACHIGVATQTGKGLIVPVMRHAEARSLRDMAAEIARLSDGARSGTLAREELSGSTMTITSLGALGAVASTPIVNHPEVAILGINRKELRPSWDGSRFVPRERMNLSASFDHRIVDGMDAAQFVARLKDLVQMPALLVAGTDAA